MLRSVFIYGEKDTVGMFWLQVLQYLITWQQQSLPCNVLANKLSCSERKAHFTLDTSAASQMSARPPCCHIIRQAHSRGSRVAGFHLSTNTITMFLQTQTQMTQRWRILILATADSHVQFELLLFCGKKNNEQSLKCAGGFRVTTPRRLMSLRLFSSRRFLHYVCSHSCALLLLFV